MSSVNKAKKIYTAEGAVARKINVKQQLERSVMSCLLFESDFYEDGVSIADRIKDLVAKNKVQDVVDITLRAKNEMRLRHVPLLLTRELFRRDDARKAAGKLLESIVTRPDDITEFLALYWQSNKDESLAKQAKLALGKAFHKFDEYSLAKYNGGNKAIKLVDALRIVHPEKSELLGKLRRNELETPNTWEVELSKGGDKKVAWTSLLQEKKLGGMAILRNIRNMVQAAVDPELIKQNIIAINAGRLLPINFIAAATHNPVFEPVIETKLLECFTKDKIAGSTVILIDVSGSMADGLSSKSTLKRIDVAASLAMIGRETFNDCRIVLFSQGVKEIPARHGFAIRDLIMQNFGGGTYLGQAIKSVKESIPHDRLIIITDEQSADSVPDFKGYLINVANNKNGIGYGQCVHIDGWSDSVIDYIVRYEQTNSGMEQ